MTTERAWLLRLKALIPTSITLSAAIGISVAVHAVMLSVHFAYPDALTHTTEHALDVVLVNSKHSKRPDQAQAKAQSNLDAGGNTNKEDRATTPLPPSPHSKEGNDLVSAQQRVAQLEALQKQMLTQLKSKKAVSASDQLTEPLPPQPTVSGMDLANRALAVARLEAQIDRQYNEYNKRPRMKYIGTRTSEYLPAQYIEDWRLKVERVGNLNYPEAARGKLYGSLLVYMEINQDGELLRAEVQRSSGQKVLDDAALRILRLAAPFGKFSNEMRQQFDVLAFARTWTFSQADQLSTSSK